jgi:hypothetical protein
MWKTILYFLLVNLAFIVLVIGIYAFGFEYDKAHKLYPETVRVSYDVSLEGIHGQRWVRFLQIMLTFGAIVDIVVIYIWFRRNQSKNNR